MPIRYPNPQDELLDRQRAIVVRENSMDPNELAERKEAADAMAHEDERHLVDYVNDCIKQSNEADKDIRTVQDHCWRVYNEDEPTYYANKEAWQSRIVVPRPYETVQYGAAAIKKAFSPDYLTIKDEKDKVAGEFWRLTMMTQNDRQHGNFIIRFADAVTMALAVGVSMEMIPRWVPGKGLVYSLVEPWKIKRDPDAPSRDNQGGLYWIHQEWLDWHVLKGGEEKGRYYDVARVKNIAETNPDDPFLTKEAIAERKKQIWNRSQFRTLHLVSEFWGVVLDKKGEVLLPRATLTIAGNRLIQRPTLVPYRRLRWPGVSFSPLPDLLRFGGRGLLKGILTVWEAMCKLQCLHEDALNWLVNPEKEIVLDNLVDPEDVEPMPGRNYLVHESVAGNQAVRVVRRPDRTSEILANQQYHDQMYQRGSMMTDVMQGLPGYRKEITFREQSQHLNQALGVYAIMGANIEQGAIDAVQAGQDVVETFATFQDYLTMYDPLLLEQMGIRPAAVKKGVIGVPQTTGAYHISGIQALMKDAETLQHLLSTVVPLATNPRFGPYIKPYQTLKAIETRTNMTDEEVFVDEEEAAAIEKNMAEMEAKTAAKAREHEDMESTQKVVDLLTRLVADGNGQKGGERARRTD